MSDEEETNGEPAEDELADEFERALEELTDEEIRAAASNPRPGVQPEPAGEEDRRERQEEENGSAESWSKSMAEEFGEIDRDSLPEERTQTETSSASDRSANVRPAKGRSAKGNSAKGNSAKGDSAKGDSAKGRSAKGDSAKGNSARESDDSEGGLDESPPMEQFEEAIQGMSPSEMRRKKYDLPDGGGPDDDVEGEGSSLSSEPGDRREERSEGGSIESSSETVSREAEEMFEAAVGEVERLETDSKYRRRSAPEVERHLTDNSGRDPGAFATPTLPKSGRGLNEIPPLDDRQEAMLARCEEWARAHDLAELNLRGERLADALDRLRTFLRQSLESGDRYVRIVHGRGLRSDGAPVLKPAVLEWIEEHAAAHINGYVPERNITGDYGSIIVEFLDDGVE